MNEVNQRTRSVQSAISRRALLRGAAALAGGAVVASCAPTTTGVQGSVAPRRLAAVQKLTMGFNKEPISLDPRENDAISQGAYNQIFDRLVAVGEDLKPIPHVAESWGVSPDGLAYTFKIRNGIRFHDGSDLTAADVKFSIDRLRPLASPKQTYLTSIDKTEVIDPRTMRVTLKAPFAPFIYAIYATAHIVPKSVVERVGDDAFKLNPVGSGPFKFLEWRKNESITLVRNESYWLKKPILERVVIRIIPDEAVIVSNLLAGDLDVIDQVTAAQYGQLQGNRDYIIQVTPAASYTYLGFANLGKTAPFTDKRLRQAVYHAVDAEGIAKVLFPVEELGVRAFASMPPSYWPGEDYTGLKALALKKDPARAKQLFDDLIRDKVIKPNDPIKIVIGSDPKRNRIGEIVAASIKEVGQNGVLEILEYASYLNRINNAPKSGEAFVFVTNTVPYAPDPDASLSWLFHSAGGHGKWLGLPDGGPLDKLLAAGVTSQDGAERDKSYNSIARTAFGDVYNIPLTFGNVVLAFNNKVQGLKPSPRYDFQLVTSFTNVSVLE